VCLVFGRRLTLVGHHNIQGGSKSKLLILSEYVTKTEKTGEM